MRSHSFVPCFEMTYVANDNFMKYINKKCNNKTKPIFFILFVNFNVALTTIFFTNVL